MCGPRPLCLGVSQGRPGSLCFQVWLRHTRGEDPLQSHNWVHLPAHWQLEASQSQLCWAPAQWAGGITVCGSRETPASAPPPLALRRARARGPGRARAPAHLAQPLARRQQRRRRSGRARARSRRSGGGDRARSTLGLCGGAGTGLRAPGGGSGASNQAAGSRPSARPARAARPAD